MGMTAEQWHERFIQQAEWTRALRDYAFEKAGLMPGQRILEVGCGSGAVLSQLPPGIKAHGLDIDLERLQLAKQVFPTAQYSAGDAHRLPYAGSSFEIVCCHYLLLWLDDPMSALRECLRTARPGGFLLALAEPDYSGRIDQPPALARLGELQTESLRRQGADPSAGGKLARWFNALGLDDIETGPMQTKSRLAPTRRAWELEWQVLEEDLSGVISKNELADLKRLDWNAWQQGERRLHIPTFYAIGRIPQPPYE
ncbi:MAG: methyltransferase domain-containing protein [Anaerolineae bacterium]|nr:methyltransferase domain-containing protein [Anaerolineae bacterium]